MKKVIYFNSFFIIFLFYACKEKQLDYSLVSPPADFGGEKSNPTGKLLYAYVKPDERGTDGCDTHLQLVFDSLNENNTTYYFKPTFLTKHKVNSLIAIRKNQRKSGKIKVKLEYVLTGKRVELDCFWNKTITNEGEIKRIEIY